MYAHEKLRELRDARRHAEVRRMLADPNAEVQRTGVGRVHEVFRRIAEGERPERQPKPHWIFAG
jgi:hypothetical protein